MYCVDDCVCAVSMLVFPYASYKPLDSFSTISRMKMMIANATNSVDSMSRVCFMICPCGSFVNLVILYNN